MSQGRVIRVVRLLIVALQRLYLNCALLCHTGLTNTELASAKDQASQVKYHELNVRSTEQGLVFMMLIHCRRHGGDIGELDTLYGVHC